MPRLELLAALTIAGCSAGAGSPATGVDASIADVVAVECAGGESSTISTVDSVLAFDPPSVAIVAGQVVKFTMSSMHDVVPDPGNDVGLQVGFSATRCLKFKTAGSYKFHCGPHQFKGVVTAQ
jgi:plastocyanin